MNGLATYDAKSKESHRGWVLNRIVERLTIPISEATVLYLVGPEDIDGELLMRKGFRSENLTAVDIKSDAVISARGCGRIAVNEDISALLACWNCEPLDVLHLDTCSTFRACDKMLNNAHQGNAISERTVIYCNMQRGREKDAEMVSGNKKLYGNHRGNWLCENLIRRVLFIESFSRCKGWPIAAQFAWMDEREGEIKMHCTPSFASYRSATVTMDSVVMRAPPRPSILVETGVGPKTQKRARRKLAAMKAVATKRRSLFLKKTTGRVAV